MENKNLMYDNFFKTFFIGTILLLFLFRHNGFYAYLLCILVFLYYFSKNIKQALILFLMPVVLFVAIGFCKQFCGIQPAPVASSLGVPLQQIARVKHFSYDKLSFQEVSDWDNIVSPQKSNIYVPYTVDTLKIDNEFLRSDFIEQSLKSNPERFISLYFNLLRKYPQDYVDAFLILNKPYWVVKYKYVTYGLYYYLYTNNRWHDYWNIKVFSKSLLPSLKQNYDNIFMRTAFNDNWLLIIYSMSFNLWMLIARYFILIYRKHYFSIVAMLIIPALVLSVIFGPMALLRYIYQNFLILPMLLAFCFSRNDICEQSKITKK